MIGGNAANQPHVHDHARHAYHDECSAQSDPWKSESAIHIAGHLVALQTTSCLAVAPLAVSWLSGTTVSFLWLKGPHRWRDLMAGNAEVNGSSPTKLL